MSGKLHLLAVLLVATFGLSACVTPGPIRGSIHSNSHQLRVGMTLADVQDIMGRPPSHVSVAPQNALFICCSYLYDELLNAKFVHVQFEDNRVIGASDGHRKVCTM